MSVEEPVILLVDDEVHILSALRRSLRREGWEIATAVSGEAALDILKRQEVDVVVTDQKMPGMSGLDFLAQLGAHAPNARRVLLTGWPEMLTQSQLTEAGIDAVIPKPWEDDHLKKTLRGLV